MPKRFRTLLGVALSLLIPILPFVLIGELPGEEWLNAAGGNALVFGASGAALLGGDAFLPVPSSVVGILLGARLGFLPGWLWGWLGLCVGNLAGYAAGRLLSLKAPMELPAAPTLLLFFATRPVPILAEALTITAGAASAPFPPFLLATTAGNGVYAAAMAASGAAVLPTAAVGPALALPMLLPALAWLCWQWYQRSRRSLENPQTPETTPCST